MYITSLVGEEVKDLLYVSLGRVIPQRVKPIKRSRRGLEYVITTALMSHQLIAQTDLKLDRLPR